jgi:hypothetical protein
MSGLAKAKSVDVRTTKATAGRRNALLCSDGRQRARLPTLGRREYVGAVSVNGSYVAWSVQARGTRGRVNVARVKNTKLLARHSTRVATGTGDALNTGAFIVHPNGTVAWSLRARAKPIGAVWRRGHAPVSFDDGVPDGPLPIAPRPEFYGFAVAIIDDRNVLLEGGATLRAYRPPAPGSCPKLSVGRWRDLGGWQIADIGGIGDEGPEQTDTLDRSAVCDPARGRYLDIATVQDHNGKGNSGRTRFSTTARNGRWLLRSVIGADDDLGESAVTITDSTTGERHVAGGNLKVAGVPHATEVPNTKDWSQREPRWQTGAVTTPGAIAWIERDAPFQSNGRDTVWLSDQNGTRIVGDVPSRSLITESPSYVRRYIAGLTIQGDILSWSIDGTTHTVPVVPTVGEPYAIDTATGS